MRTHTQEFKSKIKEHGREFNDTLYYSANGVTTTYDSEHLSNINYSFDTSLLKSVMQTLTFDSDLDLEVGNIVSYKCSLVDVQNSDIELNNFTITKKEEQKDTHNFRYTCYDNMIKSMTDYETFFVASTDTSIQDDKTYYKYINSKYIEYTPSSSSDNPSSLGLYEIAFPMTIRDYLSAICTRLGITFSNASDTFTNYNQNVTSEHYVDSDFNSLGYTYRDVLDDIAEAVGGFICIDDNGQLEIRYPSETNDTIDEEYFQDNNVNIGEHYGPINVVILSRNGVDNLVRPSGTLPSTKTEIKIENNPILGQTNRENFIDGIYNQLNGLEFYLNDFQTLGVMYYEVGDIYNVSIDNTTYQCLMLNDNIIRESGLTENIYTEEPTTSVTDYKYASDTDKLEKTSRNAYFLADKANGTAEMIVEGIGSNGQVTGASVIASINDDQSNLTLNADKINLNGAVTANNNFVINQDGSVEVNSGYLTLTDSTSNPDDKITIWKDDHSQVTVITSESFVQRTLNNDWDDWADDYINLGSSGITHQYYNDSNNYQVARIYGDIIRLTTKENGVTSRLQLQPSSSHFPGNVTIDENLTIGGILDVGKYATDLVVESIKGKNLFNKNSYSGTGQYLNNDGSISTNSNWLISNYIEVTPGEKITISGMSYPGTNPSICFYNSSKTFISGTKHNNLDNRTITIPSNCYYIRESINITNDLNTIQIERGSSATSYSEYQGIGYVSGKNANGNYIKYDDGTLICWNRILYSSTIGVTNASGNMYRSSSITPFPDFPITFLGDGSDLSISLQGLSDTNTMQWWIVKSQSSSTTNVRGIYLYSPASISVTGARLSYQAIGRWK